MYPRATDGTQTNNDKFSPCSINSIRVVLRDKATCFTSKYITHSITSSFTHLQMMVHSVVIKYEKEMRGVTVVLVINKLVIE